MNEDDVKESIEKSVIPALIEGLSKSESTFFIYIEYGEVAKGVKSTISPAPPEELIEEVISEVAKKIYSEMQELPSLIIACEQIKYLEQHIDDEEPEEMDVDLLDSGIIIVAVEARTATGFVMLYKLPDYEHLLTKEFDANSDDLPPYVMLAITAFMQQTLKEAGLVKEEDVEQDMGERRSEVNFRFSRN